MPLQASRAAVASIVSRFRTTTKDVVGGLDLDLSDSDDLLFYNCLIQRGQGFQATFALDNFANFSYTAIPFSSRCAGIFLRLINLGFVIADALSDCMYAYSPMHCHANQAGLCPHK
jgi:hypothetical protein